MLAHNFSNIVLGQRISLHGVVEADRLRIDLRLRQFYNYFIWFFEAEGAFDLLL